MAKKITYRLVCDNPIHDGALVDGDTTLPLSLPNKGPRVIELCPRCRGTVAYADFVAIVDAHGRAPGRDRLPAGATPAPAVNGTAKKAVSR